MKQKCVIWLTSDIQLSLAPPILSLNHRDGRSLTDWCVGDVYSDHIQIEVDDYIYIKIHKSVYKFDGEKANLLCSIPDDSQMICSFNNLFVLHKNQFLILLKKPKIVQTFDFNNFKMFYFLNKVYLIRPGNIFELKSDFQIAHIPTFDFNQVVFHQFGAIIVRNDSNQCFVIELFGCQQFNIDSADEILKKPPQQALFGQYYQEFYDAIDRNYYSTVDKYWQQAIAPKYLKILTHIVKTNNLSTFSLSKLVPQIHIQQCMKSIIFAIPSKSVNGVAHIGFNANIISYFQNGQVILSFKQKAVVVSSNIFTSDSVQLHKLVYFRQKQLLFEYSNGNIQTYKIPMLCNVQNALFVYQDTLHIQCDDNVVCFRQQEFFNSQFKHKQNIFTFGQMDVKFLMYQFCNCIIKLELTVINYTGSHRCRMYYFDDGQFVLFETLDFDSVLLYLSGVLYIKSTKNEYFAVDVLFHKIKKLKYIDYNSQNLDSLLELHDCGYSIYNYRLCDIFGEDYVEKRNQIWNTWFNVHGNSDVCKVETNMLYQTNLKDLKKTQRKAIDTRLIVNECQRKQRIESLSNILLKLTETAITRDNCLTSVIKFNKQSSHSCLPSVPLFLNVEDMDLDQLEILINEEEKELLQMETEYDELEKENKALKQK